MRLGDFIHANVEPILVQWEDFARTILPAANLDTPALRDHARDILLAAVRDMSSLQTGQEQADKSTGHGGDSAHSRQLDSASAHHAVSRVEAGFDVMQLISEYRALRASVIRLWQNTMPDPDHRDVQELTRFNESMDQSLAKAVHSYTSRVEEARNTFLAILSHDLRSPLAAILLSANMVRSLARDKDLVMLGTGMVNSATAMNRMVEDLLKYASTALGTRIELAARKMDLLPLCQEVVEEIRSGHPGCTVEVDVRGPTTGQWDAARLREVVSNLLSNAAKHGQSGRIGVSLTGDAEQTHVSVHNTGEPIPPELLPSIFQPMVRARRPGARNNATGVGLGLAIVERIVSAHGGRIEVVSTPEDGTTFTVHLPRTL